MSARLVVLDGGFEDIAVEVDAARPYGVEVEDAGGVVGAAVAPAAGDADGVLVRFGTIDAAVIDRCAGWRAIGRYGVGVDNVDVEAASRRGIAVINVPDYCVEEVATHTAALVLAAVRRLFEARALIDDGRWNDWRLLAPIRPLSECTLGLVGVGRIGSEVARILGPIFGRTIAHDPVAQPPAGIEPAGLDEVFAQADVVSLHCPLTAATRDLVDAARLATMRPSALLVNVSRGGLVDTAALSDAVHRGLIAGAALDVLASEPPDPDDPLLSTPHVLLTNHLAWYSENAELRLRRLLASRVSAYLAGERVPGIVNATELDQEGSR